MAKQPDNGKCGGAGKDVGGYGTMQTKNTEKKPK